VPNEKLPPALNSRLPEAWNGDGFWGAMFCWLPNWKGVAAAVGADAPNAKFDWSGAGAGCWPNTGVVGGFAGGVAWTMSSAILSSMFIWSLLTGAEPNENTGLELPKAGWVLVVAVAEVNENWGVDATAEDPNIMGELVEVTLGVDDPKENPGVDEDDELKDEPKENPEEGVDAEVNEDPNTDLLGCQLETPNTEEVVPLLELTALASEEAAGVLCPEVVPALKTFVAELEENNELPEAKPVLPVNPNNGADADELNGTDWVSEEVGNTLVTEDARLPGTDPLVVPMIEPRDWLLPVVATEELKPTMPLPVIPTEAEELPKMLFLFSSGSEPEDDDTGKLVDGKGVDPNLKTEVVGDKDGTWEEELLLVTATMAGVLLVVQGLVEVTVALLLPLLAASDELLNIFWSVKLFVTTEENGEGLEAAGTAFRFELFPKVNIFVDDGINAEETAGSDDLAVKPVNIVLDLAPAFSSSSFGIESTGLELQMKKTFSQLIVEVLHWI